MDNTYPYLFYFSLSISIIFKNIKQNNGQILWRFNASKAPHEAGTWEILVKSTKHILLKICRNALLNYVEFQTVLKETQALLNDRPLLQLSSD